MPTLDECAKQPREQRLGRMKRTADDCASVVRGQTEAALVRRPDLKNWAAKEIICHLRDTEELFMARLEMIEAVDEPMFGAAGQGTRSVNDRHSGPLGRGPAISQERCPRCS